MFSFLENTMERERKESEILKWEVAGDRFKKEDQS